MMGTQPTDFWSRSTPLGGERRTEPFEVAGGGVCGMKFRPHPFGVSTVFQRNKDAKALTPYLSRVRATCLSPLRLFDLNPKNQQSILGVVGGFFYCCNVSIME
jgi:hypothetical protein